MTAGRSKHFVDLLQVRADEDLADRGYSFLRFDGLQASSERLGFGSLFEKARRLGCMLDEAGCRGKPVLLLFEPGPGFIVAFFGSMLAGAIPVPAYPPDAFRPLRSLKRLSAMLRDSGADLILSSALVRTAMNGLSDVPPILERAEWIVLDEVGRDAANGWTPVDPQPDDVAFLQYTSGSTADPKGVVVTHANLMANADRIIRTNFLDNSTTYVNWLPQYHDFGLLGGVVQAIYYNAHSVLLSPIDFLQKPVRWLKAISEWRAVATFAPNFAYELCLRRSSEEERAGLDLSCLEVAASGAEPIRPETVKRFRETFAPYGLRPEALSAGYGLAEATLVVSAQSRQETVKFRHFERDSLASGRVAPIAGGHERARELVSCGTADPGTVRIVDLQTHEALPEGMVGEIWVSSPSVAKGYWNRPDATAESFGARLATGQGPFLRTGDIGFFWEGELYFSGRLKDRIIVRGVNHHPEDIEPTIERSHPAVRPGCVSAHQLVDDEGEGFAVAAEITEDAASDPEPVAQAIRRAIWREHGIEPNAISLLRPRTIPKTSSGKIQRRSCATGIADGELEVIHGWARGRSELSRESRDAPRRSELEAWLVAEVAEAVGLDRSEVDPRALFADLSIDSVQAVELLAALEERIGRTVEDSVLWEHPTIESLAACLVEGPPVEVGPAAERQLDEPIAIVGMACRLPGADDCDAAWELVRDGRCSVGPVPEGRWDDDVSQVDTVAGRVAAHLGGFLREIDRFDAGFFGISPREAARVDPQQRLMMEVAIEALEDAGVPWDGLAGDDLGVFVGITGFDYALLQTEVPSRADPYALTGNAHCISANRLSYFLGVRGPSLAVDTACSSSLVALHLACQSLRLGEASSALVGGVSLMATPHVSAGFARAGALATDGRCRAFDENASGMVRGEGAACVLLKPLRRALADGDRIRAVVRGSAVNNDGRTNGISAPNPDAQRSVMRAALRAAGVDARAIDYLEAHGTGTPLGDAIELQSILSVLGRGRDEESWLSVGSIKSNVGHLEAAAGVAGLVKCVLGLEHGELLPSLHFERARDGVDLERSFVRVQTAREPWPKRGTARRALLSSFGFGGTNACAVLEEAPAPRPTEPVPAPRPAGPCLVPLAAHRPGALQALVERYEALLREDDTASVEELAYNSGVRRAHPPVRAGLVVAGRDELAAQLRALAASDPSPTPEEGPTAFVFSGHGSQWWGMELELLASNPVFAEEFDRVDSALFPYLGGSLRLRMAEEGTRALFEAGGELTQPAIFAMQLGLAAVLRAWGIQPDACVGHSMGEISAACAAGCLRLEDAVRILAERNELLAETQRMGGGLALVGLDWDRAAYAIREYKDRVWVAGSTGPMLTLLAGYRRDLEALLPQLEGEGVFARRVPADGLAHCPLVAGLSEELAGRVRDIEPRDAIPLYSTALCAPIEGSGLKPSYWADNMRLPVRFTDTLGHMISDGFRSFVEVSPHPVLVGGMRQTLAAHEVQATTVYTMKRKTDARQSLLRCAGAMYERGASLDWAAVGGADRAHVRVPGVQWQRTRLWSQSTPTAELRAVPGTGFLGAEIESPALGERRVWASALSLEASPFLREHRVEGTPLLPGAAYLELACAAGREIFGEAGLCVSDLRFEHARFLEDGVAVRMQISLTPCFEGGARFEIHGRATSEMAWTLHATGRVERAAPANEPSEELAGARARCTLERSAEEGYDALRWAVEYGREFRRVTGIWSGEGESLARVDGSLRDASATGFALHPAIVDACLHGGAATMEDLPRSGLHLPSGIERVVVHRPLPPVCWCHSVRSGEAGRGYGWDSFVYDEAGALALEIIGFRLQPLAGASSVCAAPSTGLRARLGRTFDDTERGEILLEHVRRLLSAGLRCDPADLAAERSFQDLGIDSLTAVELQVQLQEDLGHEVPVSTLLKSPNLGAFAKNLVELLSGGSEHESVDLVAELASFPEIAVRGQARPARDARSVLLTGVTGFLGPHLLRSLLVHTEAQVHCLVRADQRGSAEERLRAVLTEHELLDAWSTGRVTAVDGDLGRPLLGMPEAGHAALCEEVDAIYHSGAWLNSIYPYPWLKEVNVGGTQQLIGMAAGPHPKELHHVSTMAVFPLSASGTRFGEDDAVLPEHLALGGLAGGYSESKWVAEALVRRAAVRGGLAGAIYRPGFITGHSRTGVANVEDIFCRLLKGCILLGAMPDVGTLQDMTPVDYVADAIVHLSLGEASGHYNLVNPSPMQWRDLAVWIRSRGYALELVPYGEWVEVLRAHCARDPSHPLTHMLPLLAGEGRMLFGWREWPTERTLAGLRGSGVRCAPVTDLLPRYFDYFVESGFLPPGSGSRETHVGTA